MKENTLSFPNLKTKCSDIIEGVSICVIGNLGMEKRPRRFSLSEAFFEGSHCGGREDCPEHAECKREMEISAKVRNLGA
jgi:hypothetical protein